MRFLFVVKVPGAGGKAITYRCLNRVCGYHFYASLASREEPMVFIVTEKPPHTGIPFRVVDWLFSRHQC